MSEPTRLVVGPDEPDNAQFGEILRRFRTETQLSRAQAANILGFTSEYLRLIERGVRTPAFGSMSSFLTTYRVDHQVFADYEVTFGDYVVEFTSRIKEARSKGPTEVSLSRNERIGQIVTLLTTTDSKTLRDVHDRLLTAHGSRRIHAL
jgi:transcriptional regulator with XRE-family HTH domain